MASPSREEFQLLPQFREFIERNSIRPPESMNTDIQLLTWLRARDYDMADAAQILANSLQWRKLNFIESIFEWSPPINYNNDYPYEFFGEDKEGRPVLFIPIGNWDIKKAMQKGERVTFLRYVDKIFATVKKKCEESSVVQGREVSQLLLVVDCANFSYGQLTCLTGIETLAECAKRLEANYPETIYRAVLINTSRIVQLAYLILRPFLAIRTSQKFVLFSSPETWIPELHKDIPKDILPKAYGGLK